MASDDSRYDLGREAVVATGPSPHRGPGRRDTAFPPAADEALAAAAVSKRYRRGGVWALRAVDIRIPTGSITALVGPNGSGKTTLIRSFLDFERPTTGHVRVRGIDPRRDRAAAIDRLAYVSQSSSLYRGLSVASNLELAASLRRDFDEDGAVSRLERADVPLSRRAGDLSGGQQAQVMLAIALGTRAPILLLDEPLASLDPLARHDFLAELVEDVRARGATVLMSSHIIGDVESVCDGLVVLTAGRGVFQGPTAGARAGHRLVPGWAPDHPGFVGGFARPGGERVSLVRASDPGLAPPTLEEVVMGYLASGRTGRAADGAG